MGESVGMLKVVVVQGRRLVIRDFRSSDPYVVAKLGNQVTLFSIIICFDFWWLSHLTRSLWMIRYRYDLMYPQSS